MSERFLPGDPADPHADQPLVASGAPLRAADVAVVLLHSRGESAESVTKLAEEFYRHGVAFLAPQAAKYTWYTGRTESGDGERPPRGAENADDPWLVSAVLAVDRAVSTAVDAGVPREKVVLWGFSQGACLAAEYAVRHPQRYGGVFALAGALLADHENPAGSLDGTPVFLAAGDDDPHVTREELEATRETFDALDADTTLETYPDTGHVITDEEIHATETRLDALLSE
ncbi:alpha/beta hydrolase [Halocalculus aciditolerans]|uniref:Phospholipase/carboxylesterase n=1 Tax=Halocalculus aciditolerans TaxID=1383812 RepID=A0A830FMN8_9EURY|nr:alpha/beta fold hydrolase [Halocalculus aciditolerans]GGL61587.1 phospholipase/carboxylesterase [Halocalculus aciditolerans]